MSLQLIIGRSGSGKSHQILEDITSQLREDPTGPPMILLAPEQGTFQIEQAILNAPGISGTVRLQVLGFRRLALRVMQETGGAALVPISDEGKKMLLYKIMRRHKDTLRLYGKGGDQLGLIDELNSLYTELKKHQADFNLLGGYREVLTSAPATQGENALLQDKLHDLSLLYREFDAELSGLYIDAEDHVVKLAEGAKDSAYLRGAKLWIDGFHSFTPGEYKALGELLKTVDSVTVALTLDRSYDDGAQPHELNLFHATASTYIKLRELAEAAGTEIKPTITLDSRPYPRFRDSEGLAYLEEAYERRKPWQGVKPPQGLEQDIVLLNAGSRRIEVDGAARQIRRLVREKGARYRDIAVFVRNIDDYAQVMGPIFEDYGIPYFMDKKQSLLHHPLIEFIRASLDIVLKFWRYEDVFRSVKTGFLLPADHSLTREDMDELENYVLASGIQGYRWTDGRPWKPKPSESLEDTEERRTSAAADKLKLLERCRNAVVTPLSAFDKALKQAKSAREMCLAVYGLLEAIYAADRLDLLAHQALEKGRPQQAAEHRQLWGALLDLLDQIVEMMGEEKLAPEAFAGVLETGIKSLSLGLVPPALDQVLIGSTDRTRTRRALHVFLLGVNEGIMPAGIQEEGLLSDRERSLLGALGLELAPGLTRRLLDERFLIYSALSSASRSLWLSYPQADEEGKPLLPSEVIRQIKAIFPGGMLQERKMESEPVPEYAEMLALDYISSPVPTLPRLISQLRAWRNGQPVSAVWWSALDWYNQSPEWSGVLRRLVGSLDYRNRAHSLAPATSRKLYGKVLRTSVSRMEKFSACPFSHFASHGLRLKERQLYRLKAPDIGQLFHSALSQLAVTFKEQGRSWGSLTPEECLQEADAVVERLAPKLQGEILLSTKRYGYIKRKLKQIVGRASVILGEQSRRGSFEPIGLELDFGPGRPLPPLTFELPNGCVMEIVGRIDRVDMSEGEEGVLLRVIDYKSSQTDLKLHEVYYGLSLQMLTYLDVLLSSAEMWLGRPALPAGTLYFHVHNPLLQSSNGLSEEEAYSEMLKRFKMKGLLLADREVIARMDGQLEKGYSDILPVAVKSDGSFYSTASVATLEQWQGLLSSVRHKVVDIGTRITNGEVQITPYKIAAETACAYCQFKPVCRFDEGLDGSYKVLNKPGKEELWSMLGQPGREEEQANE
ncbi:ATP-dependent helicase/deoxyribonuclease subunit B [Paenibacillus antibioticophila]|uniref:ATP-dependent helicase/deoxyribonuclease subunit B n=1 Tax=Paenibacillus antibioticophila TaxID=1274374 RepID=A0A920CGV3_9BACL|nr:helicase-exonuclease AddAB subunit AddB [Paenibacillus antibioticophila]GIO39100.1 ATP-dependent helicase/deoxyribonuclease subunit B [Paenibacillus antibioticophila]